MLSDGGVLEGPMDEEALNSSSPVQEAPSTPLPASEIMAGLTMLELNRLVSKRQLEWLSQSPCFFFMPLLHRSYDNYRMLKQLMR